MKILLRKIMASIIYYSGVIHLIGTRRKRGVILAYHKISEKDSGKRYGVRDMTVHPKTFQKHILYLKKKFRALTLEELISKLKNGENVEGKCVITFDDGWADNYLNAYPILKKYKFPATIFLVSGFVGAKKYMWFDQVAQVMGEQEWPKTGQLADFYDYPYLIKVGFFDVYSDSRLTIEEKIDAIVRRMKAFNQFEISKTIDEMAKFLKFKINLESPDQLFISWEQIKEMEKDGISFGSHTVSHINVTLEDFEIVKQEIANSKKTIESKLNKRIETFCYPYGSYSDEVKKAVKKAGYKGATTYDHGFISKGSDPYLLPRISMHEDICSSVALFACRIEGVPFF